MQGKKEAKKCFFFSVEVFEESKMRDRKNSGQRATPSETLLKSCEIEGIYTNEWRATSFVSEKRWTEWGANSIQHQKTRETKPQTRKVLSNNDFSLEWEFNAFKKHCTQHITYHALCFMLPAQRRRWKHPKEKNLLLHHIYLCLIFFGYYFAVRSLQMASYSRFYYFFWLGLELFYFTGITYTYIKFE